MNDIYRNMLAQYDLTNEQQQRNAIFEVNQQIFMTRCPSAVNYSTNTVDTR